VSLQALPLVHNLAHPQRHGRRIHADTPRFLAKNTLPPQHSHVM